jgi:putative ABC transport system ATP-binding protein
MLRELNKEGTTVIMVTHSEKEGNYADRLVRLFDGQIILDKASQFAISSDLPSEVA